MEIQTAESFLPYYERIRQRTDRVIARIPPDRLEWTHKEGAFTFGDLIRHLGALERYMFAENAQRKPSRYPGHGRELADGYDAVLEFLHEDPSDDIYEKANYVLGLSYLYSEDYASSLTQFEKLTVTYPDNLDYWAKAGTAAARAGETEKAGTFFQRYEEMKDAQVMGEE